MISWPALSTSENELRAARRLMAMILMTGVGGGCCCRRDRDRCVRRAHGPLKARTLRIKNTRTGRLGLRRLGDSVSPLKFAGLGFGGRRPLPRSVPWPGRPFAFCFGRWRPLRARIFVRNLVVGVVPRPRRVHGFFIGSGHIGGSFFLSRLLASCLGKRGHFFVGEIRGASRNPRRC